MPSMNHSGRRCRPLLVAPTPESDMLPTSNWKAWTISWPITWSVSASDPPIGRMMRRRSGSVTPPVPSPSSPWIVLVCSKSMCEAYKTSG